MRFLRGNSFMRLGALLNQRGLPAKEERRMLLQPKQLLPMALPMNRDRAASSYRKIAYQEPHMDELPIPQGSWQQAYNKQQRKNSVQLIVGLSFFIFTVLAVTTSGVVQFNATIPKLDPDDFPTSEKKACPKPGSPPPKC